jgi:hypothetical protein
MIELRRDHERFDVNMEVASLLPKLPHVAEIATMQDDLGISEDLMKAALNRLIKKYRIRYVPARNDMGVGVSDISWAAVQNDAGKYIDTVYGDNNNGI